MAAMSVTGTVFTLGSLYFIYRIGNRQEWGLVLQSNFFLFNIGFLLVACLSLLYAAFFPPFGLEISTTRELKKFLYLFYPFIVRMSI